MNVQNKKQEEWFEVVDAQGRVTGRARRSECHGNPALRHRAVHVLVFDPAGRLFLQKRSSTKDTAPGLWDTSVGGHLQPGESFEQAARREFAEELGGPVGELWPAYAYEWTTDHETELIQAFATVHAGPFRPDPEEIEEGRFWSGEEITVNLDGPLFTPQFRQEYPRMAAWWAAQHGGGGAGRS